MSTNSAINRNNSRTNAPESTTSYEKNSLSTDQEDDQETLSVSYGAFILLGGIFLCSLLYFYMIYLQFPNLEENEKEFIKLPRNINDAKQLGIILKKYSNDHYYSVLVAFVSAYVFLQTFAIPGSIFLSILSGFLYPFPLAISIVCICSALGATFCYFLSFIVARKLVLRYFKERIMAWQVKARKQKDNMLFYIIFLRITPFVPNWFMNLSSPLIDIPLMPFALGTFLGVAPPSCFYVQAGTTLKTLTSSSAVFTWQSILTLAFSSIIALLPVFFKNQLKKRVD